MITLSKGAILAAAGTLLFGGSLALSSVGAASGAGGVKPDAPVSCAKKPACSSITNSKGAAIHGISAGPTKHDTQGALEATANGLSGVYAYSSSSNGGWFENDSTSNYALYAQSDASGGYPFGTYSDVTGYGMYIDEYADGYFDGSVTADGGYYTAIHTHDGSRVGAFSAQSTRATIEDSGTARMNAGESAVRFDPAFARAIDARSGYQVFLTPDGDTRGLYVMAKYEGGFIVRETEHGRSSISFDYRIIAHPYGASEARLPELNLRRPPQARENRGQ